MEDKTMKPPNHLGFVHIFVPAEKLDSPTLLLLHGTGGDERDLLGLGRELWPGAALLSVRGKVLENGMPRFLRRFAEGVFDVDDVKARTNELAEFIDIAAGHYGFSKRHLVAAGYSNGANIAASLIFLRPHYLAAFCGGGALPSAASFHARSSAKFQRAFGVPRRWNARYYRPSQSDRATWCDTAERWSGCFDVLASRRT
jgi:predicted esterase